MCLHGTTASLESLGWAAVHLDLMSLGYSTRPGELPPACDGLGQPRRVSTLRKCFVPERVTGCVSETIEIACYVRFNGGAICWQRIQDVSAVFLSQALVYFQKPGKIVRLDKKLVCFPQDLRKSVP